jgi:hypothetical protein
MLDAHPKYLSVFLDRLALSVATLELLDPQQHEKRQQGIYNLALELRLAIQHETHPSRPERRVIGQSLGRASRARRI